MYIVYLDEFGHIGPFVSRADQKYNHSPVFGLGGYLLPYQNVRSFTTWFFQLKNNLLSAEIKSAPQHPATWEKKGADLFTTKNIKKFPEIRKAVYRVINQIFRLDGRLFYYGRQKYLPPHKSKATGLYTTCMAHAVRHVDNFCITKNKKFMMILDQHGDRIKLLETATKTMFGNQPAHCLIEPPFQVESHLYQTIQAADWIANIMGKIWTYRVASAQFPDWEWADRYFGARLDGNSTHSSLWRPRSA